MFEIKCLQVIFEHKCCLDIFALSPSMIRWIVRISPKIALLLSKNFLDFMSDTTEYQVIINLSSFRSKSYNSVVLSDSRWWIWYSTAENSRQKSCRPWQKLPPEILKTRKFYHLLLQLCSALYKQKNNGVIDDIGITKNYIYIYTYMYIYKDRQIQRHQESEW